MTRSRIVWTVFAVWISVYLTLCLLFAGAIYPQSPAGSVFRFIFGA
jgi:hypothetical protein